MIIAAVHYGPRASRNFPKYTVTEGTAPEFLNDSSGNCELVFKATCKITFDKLPTNVDIFAVGGGKPGNTDSQAYKNSYDDAYCKTASGGKGGGRVTSLNVALNTGTEYAVNIGASGMSTTAFGVTASSGAGSNGGTGAEASQRTGNTYHVAATAGADGDYAFGQYSFDEVTPAGENPKSEGWYVIVNGKYVPTTDESVQVGTTYYASNSLYNKGAKYGPGGGAGAAFASNQTGDASTGGDDGGGDGSSGNGAAGDPNTGGGGASGARVAGGSVFGAGAGGSGIVIIRNHREET